MQALPINVLCATAESRVNILASKIELSYRLLWPFDLSANVQCNSYWMTKKFFSEIRWPTQNELLIKHVLNKKPLMWPGHMTRIFSM